MMEIKLPSTGITFWPVGTGDSTTISVNGEIVVQVDIHHVEDSEKDDDPRVPIVDSLVARLPVRGGRPYLAAFGATHLDKDHVQGFAKLLEQVTMGDLWFTPRTLWETQDDSDVELCADAKAFVVEAERRLGLLKGPDTLGSGDRIRVIGYHESIEAAYGDLPDDAITVPGGSFDHIDGVDCSERFSAFVHAPFKDDTEGERNDTSFALQVTLTAGERELRALLLGDLSYPVLQKIFDRSESETLAWDVLLAPHHCSKGAMWWKSEDDAEPVLQQKLLDQIEQAAQKDAHIVASSGPIPPSDKPGDNPPHAEAAKRYSELVEDGHFLCTGEIPTEDAPEPIVFELSEDDGLTLRDASAGMDASASPSSQIREAVQKGRGAPAPATTPVGFGRE